MKRSVIGYWLFAICNLLFAASLFGQAFVATDKDDYPPGSIVNISGSGFQPYENVQCQVINLSDPTDTGPEHDPWTVQADGNGSFQTTWFVTSDEGGETLQLTATGTASGLVAQTVFTDTVTLTSATGGTAISADTANSGSWTTLTGPIFQEGVKADISIGNIIINAPTGFRFNTNVTVTVLLNGDTSHPAQNINNITNGATFNATVTATTITIVITSQSNGGAPPNKLTVQNIQVQPTTASPLQSGNMTITYSNGGAMVGVSSGTACGALTEVAGTASAYVITPATATPTAGANDQLTIKLVDQSTNTVTIFSGDKTLTFSGLGTSPAGNVPTVTDKSGSAVNQGTSELITFASGVSSAGGILVAKKAESATLNVSDNNGLSSTSAGGSGASLTVAPGAANAAHSTISPATASITADGTSTQVVTVQARDVNNNNLTTGGLTVVISRSSGTGTVGGTTDNGNGTYTATVTSPTATGSGTFVATLGGTSVGTAVGASSSVITYTPGAANAAHSTISPATASITANGTSTQVVTVQARDVNNNNLTTGGSTVVISRSSGTGTIGGTTDNGNGTYTATVTSPTATGSGTFVATLGGTSVGTAVSASSSVITYTPGAANAAHSTISPATASITANGTSTQVITVQARDVNNNNLTTGGSTVVISRSSGTGTIGGTTDNGNGTYTATVTSPTATGSGTFVATLGGTAVGTAVGASSSVVTYTPGPATKLVYTSTPASPKTGTAFSVTVESEDQFGNPSSPTSTTTVALTQSGGSGVLSGTRSNTISTSATSTVISGVLYSKPDTITLTATPVAGETSLAVANTSLTFNGPSIGTDPVTYTRVAGAALRISKADLLAVAHVTLSDAGTTNLDSVAGPTNAACSVQLLSSTYIYYTSPSNINLGDKITYTVSDSLGGTATGSILISLSSTNSGLLSIASIPGGVKVTFDGIPNYTYTLQRATSLSLGDWTDIVTQAAGNDGLFQYSDTSGQSTAYYRVRLPNH